MSKEGVYERPSHVIRNVHRRRVTPIQWTDIKNPLRESLVDPYDLQMLFTHNRSYIPYSMASTSQTGHMLLWYILNTRYMSETKGAIMGSVNHFCFGGQYEYQKVDLGNQFVFNPYAETELTREDWFSFNEFLNESVHVKDNNFIQLAKKLSNDKMTAGMQYLEVVVSHNLGDSVAQICYIRPCAI